MRISKAKFTIFVIVSALTAMSSQTQGATIFSNLGPGDSLASPGIGIGFIPFTSMFNYAGMGLTPTGQSYTLDRVELPLQLFSGPNVADVFVMGDTGGLPSGVLETFHLTGALPIGSTALIALDSIVHPRLNAGVQYWVVAAGGPSSFVSWKQNELQEMGPNVSGPTLTALVRDSDLNVREALRVSGTAVPEPGTLLPLAGVLIATALLVRARRGRGPWCGRTTTS